MEFRKTRVRALYVGTGMEVHLGLPRAAMHLGQKAVSSSMEWGNEWPLLQQDATWVNSENVVKLRVWPTVSFQ